MKDPAREASAALAGCVVADRSALGRIRMLGKDRQDLLHRLSTNEINALKPGEGSLTALLNTKGRILDLVHALVDEADLLIVASPGNGERVRAWLDTYIFREEVTLEDAGSSGCLGLYGPRAAATLERVAGGSWEGLPLAHHRRAALAGMDLRITRTYPLAGSGYLLLGEGGRTAHVRDALVEAGAVPAGSEALERLRVAAGVPELGRELTEEYNPWEIDLDYAVSLTKGCYLGQEVVARLHTYQKVQRRLAGLEIEGSSPPEPKAPIVVGPGEGGEGETAVGHVTSAALSPATGKPLALGLLRKTHALPGRELLVLSAQARLRARVITLPFSNPLAG